MHRRCGCEDGLTAVDPAMSLTRSHSTVLSRLIPDIQKSSFNCGFGPISEVALRELIAPQMTALRWIRAAAGWPWCPTPCHHASDMHSGAELRARLGSGGEVHPSGISPSPWSANSDSGVHGPSGSASKRLSTLSASACAATRCRQVHSSCDARLPNFCFNASRSLASAPTRRSTALS
jgi:hypothetical protein